MTSLKQTESEWLYMIYSYANARAKYRTETSSILFCLIKNIIKGMCQLFMAELQT